MYILHFIYGTLKPAHFPQMPYRNWMQLIVMAATCIFLWTSATANHTWYTSVVRVSKKRWWSVLKLQLIVRNLGFIFSTIDLQTSVPVLLWKLLRLKYIMILGVKTHNKVFIIKYHLFLFFNPFILKCVFNIKKIRK